MTTTPSDYYPSCIRIGGRRLWRVIRRRHPLTGVASVVWSGPSKHNCRKALVELRERAAFYSRVWPNLPPKAASRKGDRMKWTPKQTGMLRERWNLFLDRQVFRERERVVSFRNLADAQQMADRLNARLCETKAVHANLATNRRVDPKAFTLIEILVSLTIIAILLAILSPCLSAAREAGRLTCCVSNQRQCGVAVWAYYTDSRVLPLAPADPSLFDWELPASMFACVDQLREHPGMRNLYHPGELMSVGGVLDPARLWRITRHFEESPTDVLWLEQMPPTTDNRMPPGPHSGRWTRLRFDLVPVMVSPPPTTAAIPNSGD